MATREQALEQRVPAMRQLTELARQLPVSVGVTPHKDGWALKINLAKVPAGVNLPTSIGGVPTVIEATGPATFLASRPRRHR